MQLHVKLGRQEEAARWGSGSLVAFTPPPGLPTALLQDGWTVPAKRRSKPSPTVAVTV
ncbi:hypothetical protein BTM25_41910 [Actinomadura rubteroloni]|uniref:Uncharacterized protein n=1 Tax=Actinomadura rubteroloni TaxID=1926885 RepID=A0A2P4UKG1_9ACTN|nr:hypothetical protein BTM25_41910 [Actinomadura rubteroloni]